MFTTLVLVTLSADMTNNNSKYEHSTDEDGNKAGMPI